MKVIIKLVVIFFLSNIQLYAQESVATLKSELKANDGLSVDKFGNIYASNFGSYKGEEVLKINPKTKKVEVFISGLKAPTGNRVDDDGNIFVVHNVHWQDPKTKKKLVGEVLKVDSKGNRKTIATLPAFPAGIVLDKKGNAYVSNYYFPGIHKITPQGEVSLHIQDKLLAGCVGIDLDEKGNFYTANFISGNIIKIAPDKSIKVIATIPTKVKNFVIGYMVYFEGNIYATAVSENVIYKVSLDGSMKILAGNGKKATVDGTLMNSSFDRPNGIAINKKKRELYITRGEKVGALRVIKL